MCQSILIQLPHVNVPVQMWRQLKTRVTWIVKLTLTLSVTAWIRHLLHRLGCHSLEQNCNNGATHTPLYLIIFVTVQQWQVASCMKAHLGRVREQHTADCRRTCPVSFPSQTRCWNQSRRSWCSCHCPAADSLPVTVSRALSISCIFPHVKYKKLRYCEEHSASAVLSWV